MLRVRTTGGDGATTGFLKNTGAGVGAITGFRKSVGVGAGATTGFLEKVGIGGAATGFRIATDGALSRQLCLPKKSMMACCDSSEKPASPGPQGAERWIRKKENNSSGDKFV